MVDLTELLPVILIALVLWLSGLSLVFYRLLFHYRKLAKKAHEGDLVAAMQTLLSAEEKNSSAILRIKDEIAGIKKQAVSPIQKVGLTRFNPFNERGGDQSFCLCMLDGNDSGFIVTVLHTRDRSRLYAKSIEGGECKHELSVEEKKALSEALRKKN